jgi:Rrf2 family transcriptional regulator, nitric oxide-sensitive transcriptional repressor
MLSQTALYALRAMACMATCSGVISVGILATRARVPPNYLSKVLQHLAAAKLVRGRRGVGGGFVLTRPPHDITLSEVIDAVDGAFQMDKCLVGGKGSANGKAGGMCPLHRRIDSAKKAFMQVVDGSTLQDLIDEGPGAQPLCGQK